MAIVEIEGRRVHAAGSGLPVGGAYRETWTRGSCRGVETIATAEAAAQIAGYRAMADRLGDAFCIVSDADDGGRVVVDLPGALALRYVYALPV